MSFMRRRSTEPSYRLLVEDKEDGENQADETADARFPLPQRQWNRILKIALTLCTLLAFILLLVSKTFLFETRLSSTKINDLSLLHPEDHAFRTQKTIELQWQISSGLRRPDGVLKQVYLVNGQFPGPTVEARSGDRIIINVENILDAQNVSIHWHGLWMRGHNRMDGAAGVTQNSIRPGESFTYDFAIDPKQHGTFWYHAHDGVQRGDGLFGAFVIHKPRHSSERGKLTREYLVMIGDWYHRSAGQALEFFSHPGGFGNEAVPDNVLVNGRGSYRCENAVPARPIDCQPLDDGPVLRLKNDRSDSLFRIINVGSYAGFNLSMTGTSLTPVTVDGGHAVVSKSARSIGILHPGERIDMVVRRLPGAERDRHLTISLDETSFKYPNAALTNPQAFTIHDQGPSSSSYSIDEDHVESFLDLRGLKSADRYQVPQHSNQTIVLYTVTQKLAHLDNQPFGFINGTRWRPELFPARPLVDLDRSDRPSQFLIPSVSSSPSDPIYVDFIVNNLDEEGHAFHFHGHVFWVLSTFSSTQNWGSYNPFEDIVKPGGEFNLVDPVKKDTVLVPRRGYAVLRFRADNPGLWMFHCHVLWHQASGMAMAFDVQRPSALIDST